MKRSCVLAAAAFAIPSITLAGGTITSGNATFSVGVGSFSSVFDTNLGDATLKTDSASGPDIAYKYCWYYRAQANNTNRVFSSLDTPVQSYVGDTATATYTNAGPGSAGTAISDRFNATITTRLVDGGAPGQVRVEATCNFQSSPGNLATRTWEIFSLVDLDLPGGTPSTATNDSISIDPSTFLATQIDGATTDVAYVLPISTPTRFQIGSGSALRTLLGSLSGNLNNSVTPVNAQDVAAAFQWSLTLAPGESRTILLNFAVNTDALPGPTCPACAADFNSDGGVGGDDLAAFFTAYEAGDSCGDVNQDGGVGGDDLAAFFAAYEAGGC